MEQDKYIISIDQSTQGTKALLFDRTGRLLCRADRTHRQIVNDLGWVSHDGEEIYRNVIAVIRDLLHKSAIDSRKVAGLSISNQRETSLIWDKATGRPLNHAVVWQCARATEICERPDISALKEIVPEKTGLRLSPYFPAAKLCWLLENTKEAGELAGKHQLCLGTMDAYLVFRLTQGMSYRTDYSNASRTQLFNLFSLTWDEELCRAFGICPEDLPEVTDSDACFGMTDCEGTFAQPIPICGVMGDSHAALFGQNCRKRGLTKTTYGTGSSIMMNIGEKPIISRKGIVTSLAWGRSGQAEYVLEGNLNYTGAVITWLKDDLKMIACAGETEKLAEEAHQGDALYLVPAFTGLGAPYWDSHARAAITGMDRNTGRREIVRAGLECIAYQIADIIQVMEEESGIEVAELRVDGGPTRNRYLMQFQSDILKKKVAIPQAEELSGIGAAYMAGLALHIWGEEIFHNLERTLYTPKMDEKTADKKQKGWKEAVTKVIRA
ncbi:FGGY-family carbohydrate kinase [Parablautia intestinalis]|uniref:FGGY-family carbohydrate kinase n=1 Tax=Parablautia intestinalis TaxID=2320100 RepID=UPI00256EA9CD|nr:glycerol kinase [Parablautia intestinalis]MCI8615872.1 glycerol kinase GlpK [Lachnospiraceae bacterium]